MAREKRILLVRSDVRLAGPGVLMHGIAHALRKRGWHVEIASGGGPLVSRFEEDGFVHHTLPGLDLGDRSPARMLAGMWRIRNIARQGRIGIAHSFNAQAGLMAWLATRGQGVAIVNTVLGAGKERVLPKMPFKLIAVSNFVKRNLQGHGVKADKVEIVYNAVLPEDRVLPDRIAFDDLWTQRGESDRFRFVGIAMMNGDKGHHDSIEAFARLLENNAELNPELVFVGDGALRAELETFARERGVADRVEFVGAQKDVYPHLDRGHAFLHLSPQETFGMVLAEAHARGLPAISYAVGGIPEVVVDGESAILAPCGDIDAVMRAMQTFAADRDKTREMGWAGRERANALFMQPRLGERLEQVYASL